MNVVRKASVVLISLLLTNLSAVLLAQPQTQNETLLSTENAYNPIPSPDGKHIAYVRTGWGSGGDGGFGRSNLVSQVAVIDGAGIFAARKPLVDAFLSEWTSDGAQMVCYRDGEYFLVSRNGSRSSEGRFPVPTNVMGTERVSYLPRSGTMIWSRQSGFQTVLETPSGVLAKRGGWQGGLIAPSPDGKYIAIAGEWSQSHLWVYDIDRSHWADLGEASIHPDRDWDYIKPSWNPWFANSSRLAYFTHDSSVLSVSDPDGKQRTDVQIDGKAGLAASSPDGLSLAYVTFEPRRRKERPDLPFWGGTRIWVISVMGKAEPRPVTLTSPDETYDLRWLDDHTLVFDRVADVPFYKQSRLWRVDVPR